MTKSVQNIYGAALLLLAALAGSGCARPFIIRIETASIINAYGDETTREELPIDIVCVSSQQADGVGERAALGLLRQNEWFEARESGTGPVSGVAPAEIYALRHGAPDPMVDTLVGPPLESGVDRNEGEPINIPIRHPHPNDPQAAIVIFARYLDSRGVAARTPLVIQPLPSPLDTPVIRIRAERNSLRLLPRPLPQR